jgi:O-antigen ligase
MTAHKNRGNSTVNNWRETAIFGSMLLMLASLFISRAALSMTTIGFVVLTLVHKDILQQLKKFLTTPDLLLFSCLFFVPLLSGFWSQNLETWSDVVRIKLPLVFFPLAFAGDWKLTNHQWRLLAGWFLLLVTGGCVWGLVNYAQNWAQVHEGYLRAKTILTPLENDHVRYSWLVCTAVILCFFMLTTVKEASLKVLLMLGAVFLVIYLHILSARTGVLSLYIFLVLYAVWVISRRRNRVRSAAILSLIVVLPVLAYHTLPTFKARLQYVLYDLSFVKKAEYLPGSSDGARVMSLKAGWQVLQQNPLGAGAGDIMKEADKWYASHVPQVLPADKFYPSNEWLMYGGFAGWPGVLLFTIVMLLPFFSKLPGGRIFWLAFHAAAVFSFAFDMGLEVQYGVFLYAFIASWWRKWLRDTGEERKTDNQTTGVGSRSTFHFAQ